MRRVAFGLFLMVALPQLARAQVSQQCELQRSRELYTTGGGEVTYFAGPVAFACPDGMTVSADSAVFVRQTDRFDFIGNVHYADPSRRMTADYAQYARSERRVLAQGNVVLTNTRDGSTLHAPMLDFFQEGPNNPQSRADVYSGRPRATLYRQRANSSRIDTTRIVSERMQIVGEEVFRGWGRVEINRGDMNARAEYAEYDQTANRMRLAGQAIVETDTLTLSADSIDADMVNGDQLHELRARGNARLVSEEVTGDAPVLRIAFTEGEVERLIALGGARVRAGTPQAKAISEEFTLTADSIEALSPQQKLERVFAVGSAHGERRPDSTDVNLPPLIARDWVRGDTVRAYFAQDTVAADTAERVLERIVASGNPASSTYRMKEVVNDTLQVSANYLTARIIDVTLRAGEVDQVRAEGDIKGVHLQRPRPEQTATVARPPDGNR